MVKFVAALGLAAALSAAGPPARAAEPVYREIRDWVVVCDNVRICQARAAPEADGAFDGYLDILREPGPTGRLTVTIAERYDSAPPSPASLALDRRPVARALAWRIQRDEPAAVLEGDDALGFVRAIRNGDQLSWSAGGAVRAVSLKGLSAVLLAMDESQGRLQTTGAFVRVGPIPNAAVPSAEPPPVIRARPAPPALFAPPGFAAAVRRAQAETLRAHECQDDVSSADAAWPLTQTELLVVVGCIQGAYQTGVLAFRAPRAAPARASLLVLPLAPGETPPAPQDAGAYVAEDGWDAQTATFTEFAKGRGLADCGSTTSWTFDGQRFLLSAAARLNRCSGGPPGDWPTTYRTQVEVR